MTDIVARVEEWRPAVGYPNYSVSNFGRVRRTVAYRSTQAGHILKPGSHQAGHLRVYLCHGAGSEKTVFVHRLVAAAFLDPDPSRPFVNHKDSNPQNNHVSNLEWCTQKENVKHAAACGRMSIGEANSKAKLTESDVVLIRSTVGKTKELRLRFGVSKYTIQAARRGKTWKHLTTAEKEPARGK